MTTKPIQISVYCDGGCDNRSGIDDHHAYGSFAAISSGVEIKHQTIYYIDVDTNNEAEYRTLLEALKFIYKFEQQSGVPILWTIFTDSQLMERQLAGKYRVKADNLRPFHQKAQNFLKSHPNVRVEWVRRENIVRILGH